MKFHDSYLDERITKRSREDHVSTSFDNPPTRSEERHWPSLHSIGRLFNDFGVNFDPVNECLIVTNVNWSPNFGWIDPEFIEDENEIVENEAVIDVEEIIEDEGRNEVEPDTEAAATENLETEESAAEDTGSGTEEAGIDDIETGEPNVVEPNPDVETEESAAEDRGSGTEEAGIDDIETGEPNVVEPNPDAANQDEFEIGNLNRSPENDINKENEVDSEVFENERERESTPKVYSQKSDEFNSSYVSSLTGSERHALSAELCDHDKLCILKNRSLDENICCFCQSFVDLEIGTVMTRGIIRRLEENGLIPLKFSRGDSFSIFFENKSDQLNQFICFECLPKTDHTGSNSETFHRLNERVFRKTWLFKVNAADQTCFYKMFGKHKIHDRVAHRIEKLNIKLKHQMATKIARPGLFGHFEPEPAQFEYTGERLFILCGITEEDLGEMLEYLSEFESRRDFIRSLTLKEAVTAYFYFLRQNCGFNILREIINDKKSTLNYHFVIKTETLTQIIYKITYVLGGPNKTPNSELKGQFYKSFRDKKVFDNLQRPLGSFTTDYLGWQQTHLKTEFLLGNACTALQKCKETFSSEDILNYYNMYQNEEDEVIQLWSKQVLAKDVFIAVDASYLYCRKPDDMHYVKKLYSMHKKKHLTKFMLYCSSMGYIYDLSGNWATDGAHNDAKIMQLEMRQNKNLRIFFDEMRSLGIKITLVGDRGFRDAVSETLELFPDTVKVIIPPLQQSPLNALGKPKTQKRNAASKLSNEKANDARITAQDRSIVECLNRIFKTFKAFDQIVELTHVYSGFQITSLRIVASILNRRFMRRGWIQRDSSPKMFRLDLLKSYYVKRYQEGRLVRIPRLMFVQNDSTFFTFRKRGNEIWRNIGPKTNFFEKFQSEFPEVTFTSVEKKKEVKTSIINTDLVHFSLGEYHAKSASRYLGTQQYKDNHFFMQELALVENKKQPSDDLQKIYDNLVEKYPEWIKRRLSLLRFLVPAQFSPSEHRVFLIFSRNTEFKTGIENEPDAHFLSRIEDFYCDCKTGARSLGSCSHVCAALLGARGVTETHGKHLDREIMDERTYQRVEPSQENQTKERKKSTESVHSGASDTENLADFDPVVFNEEPDDINSEAEDQSEVMKAFEKELNRLDHIKIPTSNSQDSFKHVNYYKYRTYRSNNP